MMLFKRQAAQKHRETARLFASTWTTRVFLLSAYLLTACADPVLDQKLAALGPESPEGPGPNHRPGQLCVVCHNPAGDAKPHFALAGTVYRDKGGKVPIGDVEVILTDARGSKFVGKSNCSGNFYFPIESTTPAFPVWVSMKKNDHQINMESAIFREPDCALCHSEPAGPTSAGAVFLTDDPELASEFKPTPCAP
ncbi:MAG TPA: hypothetical protein VGG33_22640 [Polyangia bacterium]